MKKKNQSGFSALEGVIILAVVAVIGVGGWYIWQRHGQSPAAKYTTKTSASAVKETIENTVYSKIPTDLKTAIFTETQKATPGCIKDSQIVDYNGKPEDKTVTYAANGFAITGIGCDGGSSYLFVKQDAVWKAVAHTQLAFECSLLKNYKVPVALLKTAYAYDNPNRCLPADPSAPMETYTGP